MSESGLGPKSDSAFVEHCRYRCVANRAAVRRPSKWWLTVSIVCWVLAVGFFFAAYRFQSQATEPRGEGELFVTDAESIEGFLDMPVNMDEAVRRSRNALDVEAVSIVDESGRVTSSTSETLVGLEFGDSLLGFGASSGRFVALASPVAQALEIDGVVEWEAGAILYQVLSPLSDGHSALVHYDVSQLLSRRAQPGEVQPETFQLNGLGVVFVLLGGVVLLGHMRGSKRYQEIEIESDLLRKHSIELETTNLELHEARNAAESALALAEEKIRIRSEFVLMINHELRTPLTSVVTGAELLKGGLLGPDDRREVVEGMVTDGHRLQGIIDQILAVARIENRDLTTQLKTMPIRELAEELDAEVTSETSLRAYTDPNTLKLVVSSLIDNARTHGSTEVSVRCGPRASITPMIELGDCPKTSMYVTVSDNGPGIDEEFLPRVFEKFEKSSFSSGTGLGLYMVRIMVDSLRGSIGVTTSSLGTTFEIALPAVMTAPLVVAR